MGQAEPGKTRGLTGAGPGWEHHEAPESVFGQVWNQTNQF